MKVFALDSLVDVEWRRGERFEYPADFRPEEVTRGAFGLRPSG